MGLFGKDEKEMKEDISNNYEMVHHLRNVLRGLKSMVASNNAMLIENNTDDSYDKDCRLVELENKIDVIHQKVCNHEDTYKAITHAFNQERYFEEVCKECGKEIFKYNLESNKGKRAYYKHLRTTKEKSIEQAREEIEGLNKALGELENE